jgi:outer membrane protein TolC
VQRVVLNTLLDRAGDKAALPDVRAVTELQLKRLDAKLAATTGGLVPDRALREQARREIAAYFDGDDTPAARSRFPVIPFPWP